MKPPKILSDGGDVLRPGLDYRGDLAVVTVSVQVQTGKNSPPQWRVLAVTSEGKAGLVEGVRAKSGRRTLTFTHPPAVMPSLARWHPEGMERYRKGEVLNAADLFETILATTEKYVELPSWGVAETVALWIIGTYLFPLFPAYPYLELNGPRGSGKSKLLSLLAELCFNSRLIVAPTEATTFRIIEETRGTILFDEAETFNKDQKATLLQILNTGYRMGCAVPRCEERDGQQIVREFDVYSPKAFASIEGIDSTTATRCIRVQCLRTTHKARGDLAITRDCEPWAEIRHRLYSLALTDFKTVREFFKAAEARPFTNRDNEKWSPLLALAMYFEKCGCRGLTKAVTEFARQTLGQADESSLPREEEVLLRVLYALTSTTPPREMTPKEICEAAKLLKSEGAMLWPQAVGRSLLRLGFQKMRHTNKGELYAITRKQVMDVAIRYGVTFEESAANPSQPSPTTPTES
jgi:hypothetical protein